MLDPEKIGSVLFWWFMQITSACSLAKSKNRTSAKCKIKVRLNKVQIRINLFIFAMKGKTTSCMFTVLPTVSKALHTLIWMKQIFSLSLRKTLCPNDRRLWKYLCAHENVKTITNAETCTPAGNKVYMHCSEHFPISGSDLKTWTVVANYLLWSGTRTPPTRKPSLCQEMLHSYSDICLHLLYLITVDSCRQ